MKELSKTKNSLEKAREELFHYMNSSEDYQDLTEHFDNLFKNSPEVYEIILLLYQELQTREKINKKKISKILYEQLNNKQYSIDILNDVFNELKFIKEKIGDIDKNNSILTKLKNGLNWKNTWKSILLVSIIIFIFICIKQFVPELYNVIILEILNIFKKGL